MAASRLPVYRPFGGVAYFATDREVRELIRGGCAVAFNGPKKKRLYGCILMEGPSRPHAGTRYVHCRDVSEAWIDRDGVVRRRHPLDANVRGVYTLKRISNLDRDLFMQVQTDCLAPFPKAA